ncbi:MAG: PAS domain S-box protein [Bacteroidales bacterium]
MDCKTIRGLILDASELTAGLIVSELKAHGCELDLLHACTMHEFEKSIRTSLPDIIFCNHLPPVIDAVTAFKLKRDICPGTPFFCISESFDDETVTELLRQGASDCIVRANHTWIEILAIKALREIENSQEHRKYDQRMYESQEKYSILFDTMPVGVIYQDATGEIISANPASEKILGISLDQMKGKTSMDPRWKMITEEGLDVPGSEHPAMIALRTGQKVGPVTRGIYLPDKNDYIWLAITATPLFRSGETSPFQVYASFEDITLKRKNEIAVKHQWQLLETVINHLPAAVNVLSGDDFRIKLANPSYRAFAPGKEMIGLTWDELWPETGQDFKRICKQVLDTGEPFSVIDQHNTIRRSPEGPLEDAYFSWSLNRIKLPGEEGWGLLSTAWETNQRKNAESELEKSNHRLKKVLEAENVGVMFWNTEKGLLMDANDAFLKMMGYDRDDIEKQEFTWQKFTPQEYHGISLEEMEKFRTIGRVGPYEKEYYCKDGSRKWLFFAGSSLGGNECVEFCIDISDRKRLEKELEEKQVLIHEMGKAAKVGGWDFDVRTGKGTWTEETARIHDMDPSVETNVDLGVSFFKPNSKQKIEEAIHKIIETGVPYNLELELVSAKGVEKWVQTIGNPVFENGKVIKVRGSIQDITARKLTEIAIAESEARYRSLFENMNAGFVLFKAITNEQGVAVDLKILAANSGFEKTTGLSLNNAIGQHLSKVLPGIEKDEADWIGKYS